MSLDARKYYGGNFLTHRTWDGIDKPDYHILMKITEEELDFKGGRFEKFKYGSTDKKVPVRIPKSRDKNTELFDWVAENIEDTWAVGVSDAFEDWHFMIERQDWHGYIDFHAYVFYFATEEDVLKFMLRWSE